MKVALKSANSRFECLGHPCYSSLGCVDALVHPWFVFDLRTAKIFEIPLVAYCRNTETTII